MDFGRILNTLLAGKKIEMFKGVNITILLDNMANTIDHSMEKTAAFIAKLQEYDIYNINPFMLCCLCNDIYLKDYKYCPELNKQIIHLWTSKYTKPSLTINDIRFIFETYVKYAIIELQTQYLADAQIFEDGDKNHCVLQRKIKKCAEICIMLNSGVVFKEFVDCFNNGYFN
jgi:hypothetical protein